MFNTKEPDVPNLSLKIDDLGKERELRALRARVQLLEGDLVRSQGRVVPAVSLERSSKDHSLGKCGYHPHVVVYELTPRVECAVCCEEMSALDVLRQFARSERSFAYTSNDLIDQQKKLAAEVAELKRVRDNLRAQLRRHKGKGDGKGSSLVDDIETAIRNADSPLPRNTP